MLLRDHRSCGVERAHGTLSITLGVRQGFGSSALMTDSLRGIRAVLDPGAAPQCPGAGPRRSKPFQAHLLHFLPRGYRKSLY